MNIQRPGRRQEPCRIDVHEAPTERGVMTSLASSTGAEREGDDT